MALGRPNLGPPSSSSASTALEKSIAITTELRTWHRCDAYARGEFAIEIKETGD